MTLPNRRTILHALGGASTLGALGSGAAQGQTHEICINAPNDAKDGYPYEFAVSGRLEKASAAQHAPWDNSVVTADPEDDIDGTGCRVHGVAQGGADCYRFTGDIVAFSVPEQWADQYTIHTSGYERHASDLQTQRDPSEVSCVGQEDGDSGGTQDSTGDRGQGDEFCPLENTVKIQKVDSDWNAEVNYMIGVTGEVELASGRRVASVSGSLPDDTGNRFQVAFSYSGEVSRLQVRGPTRVSMNQPRPCKDNS